MILLISAVFTPEPVVSASLTNDLALALSENLKVIVLTPKPTRPFGFSYTKELEEKRSFDHVVLNSYTCSESKILGRMRESYSFGKYAVNYIKKNLSDINCIYFNVWPLLAQYLIVKASKKYCIPSIIHVQDIYPESLLNKIHLFKGFIKKLLLPIDKYTLRNVSKIVAISDKMASTLIQSRGIQASKIEVVYNWQNENDFLKFHELKVTKNNNESENSTFTFMYLGNIGPVAKVDYLIRSFAKANIKNSLLIIAGSGSSKNNCVEIANSYKNAKIEFWNVPSGMVPEIQNKADILLLPVRKGASLSSIPSKLSAYMFSAKPIIASLEEKSDIASAINNSKCGWVVPPEDIDSLSDTLKAVSSIPKIERQEYGQNGFNYAMENFSKKENLKKLVSIINKMINI